MCDTHTYTQTKAKLYIGDNKMTFSTVMEVSKSVKFLYVSKQEVSTLYRKELLCESQSTPG